jgi:hypothetical protein
MPTDVATPLPQLDLAEGTVVTVTLDDPAAIVTSLTLHGWQEVPGTPLTSPDIVLAITPDQVATG